MFTLLLESVSNPFSLDPSLPLCCTRPVQTPFVGCCGRRIRATTQDSLLWFRSLILSYPNRSKADNVFRDRLERLRRLPPASSTGHDLPRSNQSLTHSQPIRPSTHPSINRVKISTIVHGFRIRGRNVQGLASQLTTSSSTASAPCAVSASSRRST